MSNWNRLRTIVVYLSSKHGGEIERNRMYKYVMSIFVRISVRISMNLWSPFIVGVAFGVLPVSIVSHLLLSHSCVVQHKIIWLYFDRQNTGEFIGDQSVYTVFFGRQ